jgi:hypothetical protein
MPFVRYSLLVFSTHVDHCIYHREWKAEPETGSKEDRERLLFGLQYSLHRTALYMSPKDKPGMLSSLTTSGYKIHFFETVTGYVFLLLTNPGQPNLRDKMRSFFTHVFLPNVVMNPLYELNTKIELASFDAAVDSYNWERPGS